MKSTSKTTHFSHVPQSRHSRSTFDISSNLKTSFNTSVLYPHFVLEVLPGDTIDLNQSNFVRMNPTVTPIMDNAYVDTHFFFVPNRLVWDHWEEFNGQQKNPGDSIDYLIPQVVSPTGGWTVVQPASYMGVAMYQAGISHSALPLRAYNLIWNEWFRDQNLQNSLNVPTGDGPDNPTDYGSCAVRNKFHDYFTSCLPFPQKGPSVMIPTSATVPVQRLTNAGGWSVVAAGSDTPSAAGNLTSSGGGALLVSGGVSLNPNGGLVADLTQNAQATINALRQAEAIQTLLERDARGGTRYTEMIRSHFGVISPDARLQRPEYLGGNSIPVNITPVTQNSETGATPQGNLAGMGMLSSHNARFVKSFSEHGYIIGVVSSRSDLHYQQGTDRHWFRKTRYDYYVPALANLGEQAVLNQEIFTQGTSADKDVFGYQERWAEYKYKPSHITGALNSVVPQSLDVWHLAQDFPSLPLLNSSFVKDGTPELRVLSVTTENTFVADFFFQTKRSSVMPTYSIPGMGTRF